MANSFLESLITGCVTILCSVCARASVTFVDNTKISRQEHYEGDNVTIDCSTTEPAYYSALSFHREPVPLLYLVPDGQKLIQKEQVFTITNLTKIDAGSYGCLAKDKNLQSSSIVRTAVEVISPSTPQIVGSASNVKQPVETASTKVSASKPYIYFKIKSPIHFHVRHDTKKFNMSVTVKGLQPIKIQWRKNQHDLMIGSRYKTFDNGRRLIVEPPYSWKDSGTYSVSACNSIGCGIQGVQVIFHGVAMPNIANSSRTYERNSSIIYESEEGEGPIVDWLKKYGFLGIPVFLAMVLLAAIAFTAGGSKMMMRTKIQTFIEEYLVQNNRGAGRTASVWSWHSEEEDSSPDEMPDYDKMKKPHKSSTQNYRDSQHHEYEEYSEYGQQNSEVGDIGRQSISHETGQYSGHQAQQVYTAQARQHNLGREDYSSIYDLHRQGVQSKGDMKLLEIHGETTDTEYHSSNHDCHEQCLASDEGSDAHRHTTVADHESNQRWHTSFAAHVRQGIQPLIATVLQTVQPATATTGQREDTQEHEDNSYPHILEID